MSTVGILDKIPELFLRIGYRHGIVSYNTCALFSWFMTHIEAAISVLVEREA